MCRLTEGGLGAVFVLLRCAVRGITWKEVKRGALGGVILRECHKTIREGGAAPSADTDTKWRALFSFFFFFFFKTAAPDPVLTCHVNERSLLKRRFFFNAT